MNNLVITDLTGLGALDPNLSVKNPSLSINFDYNISYSYFFFFLFFFVDFFKLFLVTH